MNNLKDAYIQVTVTKPKHIRNNDYSLFTQKLVDSGYSLRDAMILSEKDLKNTLKYLKTFHNLE